MHKLGVAEGKLRITLIGGHAQPQIQVELDAERTNLVGFCGREKSRRVLARCVRGDREPVALSASGSLAVKLARR